MSTLDEKLVLRTATQQDIEPMCSLLEELFSIETNFRAEREKQRRALAMLIAKNDCLVLVASLNSSVLAMCSVQPLISTAQGGLVGLIEDVIVKKEFRGLGIGRNIIGKAISWASTQGMTRLQLLADSDNAPARDFYRRIGWNETGMICLRKFTAGQA